MIYLFQRIIQNDHQWIRPSRGRLRNGEGDYVKKNGFGHEDWNFNKNLLIDGYIYGYCYYSPREDKRNEKFNIAFATYSNGRWNLAGFYLDCDFVNTPPVSREVVEQKMNDLKALGDSIGKEYQGLKEKDFIKKLKEEAQYLRWRVLPGNAIRTMQPITIPKNVFNTKNCHLTKPTNLEKRQFESLYSLVQEQVTDVDYGDDSEFPEGKETERKHKARERNQALIKRVKASFKQKHGKLYCQVCDFSFYDKYGEIGDDFIEAHHIIPLSELKGEEKTNPRDIALVCSNCHRMLHRKRPWLKRENLKNLITK